MQPDPDPKCAPCAASQTGERHLCAEIFADDNPRCSCSCYAAAKKPLRNRGVTQRPCDLIGHSGHNLAWCERCASRKLRHWYCPQIGEPHPGAVAADKLAAQRARSQTRSQTH